MMRKGSVVLLIFFSDKNAFSRFEVVDTGCNLSDHVPILVECAVTTSVCSCVAQVTSTLQRIASVSRLRWDYGNLPLYHDLSWLYLQPVLQKLIELENCADVGVDVETLDQLYSAITHNLKVCSDLAIPCFKEIFFKFWWDQDLDDMKSRSIASCSIWKAAGRPRSGPIFDSYRKDKAAYRHRIREKRALKMKFILMNCTRHYLRNRVIPFGNVGVVSLIRVVVWLVVSMVLQIVQSLLIILCHISLSHVVATMLRPLAD